ncbi:hypothetical protein GCM10008090_33530 [Arenicella chitinivorans]|uniref:DSP-PTPase phosphatase fused to NAD+ Kinase domain-containing protein n=1 Tax=Arenicella chitinivorans TaxID=1329800 RepID=A0A918S554_9GAMM|nr:tyrosine-protein phosphatase [Arenicella chitinivorans]GHA20879.1 hypothetical protein GCM10008090_33530 [Arenicella chitinivorans]
MINLHNARALSVAFATILTVLTGCTNHQTTTHESHPSEIAYPASIKHVENGMYSASQPSQSDLRALKALGVKTVISLRNPAEIDWDEAALVSELGMQFINLPVAGAAGVNEENARELARLIGQHDDEPLLVHCGSGNRVGALMATAANKVDQQDAETSIAIGKKWGMTTLEPKVRWLIESE